MTSDPLLQKIIQQKYQIFQKLGEGGFGAVYKAQDLLLGRDVAIKVLHKHLVTDQDTVKRFHTEGMIASQLRHPYALRIYDIGQSEDGYLWLAMELLSGEDLADRIAKGPLPPKTLVEWMHPICEVLEEAHSLGVVHRDIKSQNIFLSEYQGRVIPKLLDFGISRLTQEQSSEQSRMVIGSFSYMAPEQFQGAMYATAQSDIYALGVVLYESLCGVLPLDAANITEWAMKHFGKPERVVPLRERRPEISVALNDIVMQALDRDETKRPKTAMAFFHALQSALQAVPVLSTVIVAPVVPVPPVASVVSVKPVVPVSKPPQLVSSGIEKKPQATEETQEDEKHRERQMTELLKSVKVSAPVARSENIVSSKSAKVEVSPVLPAERFVFCEDGLVRDQKTGLMWGARASCPSEPLRWQSAAEFCAKYRGGGYADWRLPSPEEILALLESGVRAPETAWLPLRVWSSAQLAGSYTSVDCRDASVELYEGSFVSRGGVGNVVLPVRDDKS